MTIDLGTVITSGWATTVFLLLLICVGIPWLLVSDRLVTRGRLRSIEQDRNYWRKAAELERERANTASATVTRVLPAAEQAVRVVEAITEVASQRAGIERGEAG